MSITADHVRHVFARYCELVTRGDFDAVALLYAENATVEDPVGSEPHRGRDAIREFYRASAGSGTASSSRDASAPPAARAPPR